MRFFWGIFLLLLCHALPAQILIDESFEGGGLPANWLRQAQSGSDGWQFGTADALSPASWEIPARPSIAASNDDDCDCDKSRDLLWMPSIQPNNGTQLFLQFDAYIDGFFGSVGKVVLTKDNGNTFQELFTIPTSGFWQTITLDLSSEVDGSAFRLGFLHDDSGNWATGFGIDEVLVKIPAERDVKLQEINVVPFVEAGIQSIPLKIFNEGGAPIQSLEVGFQVNGGSIQTQSLTGLNIQSLTSAEIILENIWQADPGNTDLSVEITQVNGQPDGNPVDNDGQITVGVATQLAPAMLLLEHFTQHNCDICADQNPAFEVVIDDRFQELAVISYHTFWPSPNDDPMHQANVNAQLSMIDFYDIVAVPRAFVNGNLIQGGSFEGAPNGLSTSLIDQVNRQKGLYQLDINQHVSGSQLVVDLRVEPYVVPAGIQPQLKLAMVEDKLEFNSPPGDNGERIFEHVFREFLNGPLGENIASLGVGNSLNRQYTLDLDPAWNTDRLRVIGWVQDTLSANVWGTNRTGTLTSNDFTTEEIPFFYQIENEWLRMGAIQQGLVKVRLRDISGREIWKQEIQSFQSVRLPLLAEGIYLMTFETNTRLYTVRFRAGN